jgi:hypothetical protein
MYGFESAAFLILLEAYLGCHQVPPLSSASSAKTSFCAPAHSQKYFWAVMYAMPGLYLTKEKLASTRLGYWEIEV